MKNRCIICIIIFFQIFNLLYWGIEKEGYHGDELYSYAFVCQTEYPSINMDRSEGDFLNAWHGSEYFQDYLIVSDDEVFDLSGTYESITHDVHPPIFYLLLKISCSIFKNHFTKWAGIGLNIIFFVLTIIVLYAMSCELIESGWGRIVPMIAYGFSVGAVSTVVFVRMYMILTFATAMFCYLHILLWKNLQTDKRKKRITIYCGIFLTTILGFLTQYYFIVFAFFVCAVIWLYFVMARRIELIVGYAITMLSGLITSFLLWPSMYNHIFQNYRGKEAFDNFGSVSSESRVKAFVTLIDKELFAGMGSIILILFGILVFLILFGCFYKVKRLNFTKESVLSYELERKKMPEKISGEMGVHFWIWLDFAVAVCFDILIISKIAPYKVDRYVFNVFPLIVLLVVVLALHLLRKISLNRILKVCGIVLVIVIVLVGYKTTGVAYLYKGTADKLNMAKQYSDLPVILLTYENARFTSNCESIYFQNGQEVYPIDATGIEKISSALQEVGSTSFILYIDKNYSDVDAVLQQVKEQTDAEETKWLYSTNVCAVYRVDR